MRNAASATFGRLGSIATVREFPEAARAVVRWGRKRLSARKARLQADPIITRVRDLRSANPGRQLCGIFLVEHIGDIIACEPVIGWLRRTAPDAFVVWIVKKSYVELVAHHPDLDAVIPVESLGVVAPIVRSGVFDRCLDLHVNHKPTGLKNLDHVKAWGDPSVDCWNYFRHDTILRAFTKGAGIPALSEAARLHVPEDVRRRVDRIGLPARFLVIHTASNEKSRDWSPQAWEELVDHLVHRLGIRVVEVGLTSAISSAKTGFTSLCGTLSLLETAEVVRRASFFIGIDSGIAHMANVWLVPSLLLFGTYKGEDGWIPYEGFFRTDPDRWILRRSGPLHEQGTEEVIDRLESMLSAARISFA